VKVSIQQIEDAAAAMHLAGRALLEEQPHVSWKLKEDGTFVTGLDLRTQEFLEVRLRQIFPASGFVGEETPRTWPELSDPVTRIILDPIDGTAPFARGLNCFGISLAVIDEQHYPLLAIVHLPGLGKCYAASFEGRKPTQYQVTSDGDSVRVVGSEQPQIRVDWRIEDSYIYLGSDAHRRLDLSRCKAKIRALGSTAAHLALLTEGTLDPAAVILTRYRVWDVAAGLALASSAGLEIRNLTAGTPYKPEAIFVAAGDVPPVLLAGHPDVLRSLGDQISLRGT